MVLCNVNAVFIVLVSSKCQSLCLRFHASLSQTELVLVSVTIQTRYNREIDHEIIGSSFVFCNSL